MMQDRKPEPWDRHTPGPWIVSHDVSRLYKGLIAVLDDERNIIVCDDNDHAVTGEECEANAHLIANAPRLAREREELMDGLREAVEMLPSFPRGGISDGKKIRLAALLARIEQGESS